MRRSLSDQRTVADLIDGARFRLSVGAHPERAHEDADRLLLHIVQEHDPKRNNAWLMTNRASLLLPRTEARFDAFVDRRATGEPIQYITGEQEFYGLPFRVTPDVLIPRPETEHVVEKTLELAATLDSTVTGHDFSRAESRTEQDRAIAPAEFPRILDVGTGSGAIAVALAHNLPNAQIIAVDVSPAALKVASGNAERNGVKDRIRFRQSDLLATVADQRFQMVVSNPPYVPTADRDSLSIEVREHEPALALFAGEDGLDVFRRLIPAAFAVLEPSGFLLMEIGFGQSAAVAALLADAGFGGIDFLPDLQGIPRVACAQRPA
jgi:release factor glutamine methyltransferase